MDYRLNEFGQRVGLPVEGWSPPPLPPREMLEGRYCRVEPLDFDRHAERLYAAVREDVEGSWTYLPYGPFPARETYLDWMRSTCLGEDPLFHAIVNAATGEPVGVASYLRISPANGSIEVGHLHYSPRLQRTPAATEAMYLMMQRAFALGYRRYEWKCDRLNEPSRAAAQRLGFSFEGIFRQATVYKGRNRDTAWYAVVDQDWPALDAAYRQWLDPANFDADGRQRLRLSDLTGPLLHRRG